MDRGSGTLSTQMADFVIVCIIRQYTRAISAKKSEKGEVTCGLSLSPPTFIICPHLLLFSIHLLKNTFPYVILNRTTGQSFLCIFSFDTRIEYYDAYQFALCHEI